MEEEEILPFKQTITDFVTQFEYSPPPPHLQPNVIRSFVRSLTTSRLAHFHPVDDNFVQSVYQSLCIRLYRTTCINPSLQKSDQDTWEMCQKLSLFLEPRHLEVRFPDPEAYNLGVEQVAANLRNIRAPFSCSEKMKVLRSSFEMVSSILGDSYMGEDLINFLTFAVLEAQVPDLSQQINYCERFFESDEKHGQDDFILTVMRAVLTFIPGLTASSLVIEASLWDTYMKSDTEAHTPLSPRSTPMQQSSWSQLDEEAGESGSAAQMEPPSPMITPSGQSFDEISLDDRRLDLAAGDTWWRQWEDERQVTETTEWSDILLQEHARPITMKGWMWKEGHWVKSWKRRWCELRGCVLFYAKTSLDLANAKWSGAIDLSHAFIRCPGIDHNSGGCFDVVSPWRVFHFRLTPPNRNSVEPKLSEPMADWLNALNKETLFSLAFSDGTIPPLHSRFPLRSHMARPRHSVSEPHSKLKIWIMRRLSIVSGVWLWLSALFVYCFFPGESDRLAWAPQRHEEYAPHSHSSERVWCSMRRHGFERITWATLCYLLLVTVIFAIFAFSPTSRDSSCLEPYLNEGHLRGTGIGLLVDSSLLSQESLTHPLRLVQRFVVRSNISKRDLFMRELSIYNKLAEDLSVLKVVVIPSVRAWPDQASACNIAKLLDEWVFLGGQLVVLGSSLAPLVLNTITQSSKFQHQGFGSSQNLTAVGDPESAFTLCEHTWNDRGQFSFVRPDASLRLSEIYSDRPRQLIGLLSIQHGAGHILYNALDYVSTPGLQSECIFSRSLAPVTSK